MKLRIAKNIWLKGVFDFLGNDYIGINVTWKRKVCIVNECKKQYSELRQEEIGFT